MTPTANDGWRSQHLGRLLGHAMRRFDARVLDLMSRDEAAPLALANLAARQKIGASHVHIVRHLALAGERPRDLARAAGVSKQAAGQIVRLVSDEQVRAAVTTPPEDTRAWFRGECLRRYAAQVVSASWDSVVVEVPGQTSLQRIPMPEPLRGTRAQVAAVLDRSPDIATLLRELARSDD